MYDSAGNDRLYASSTLTALYGDSFYNLAKGFRRVHAYATAGGNDVARMYDSAGNDQLVASGNSAEFLYADGKSVSVEDFTWVEASASNGGTDTKDVEPVDYVLQTSGDWLDT